MSGPLPDGAVDEFANTFREWHYFVGGAALAALVLFPVGVFLGLWAVTRWSEWVDPEGRHRLGPPVET